MTDDTFQPVLTTPSEEKDRQHKEQHCPLKKRDHPKQNSPPFFFFLGKGLDIKDNLKNRD